MKERSQSFLERLTGTRVVANDFSSEEDQYQEEDTGNAYAQNMESEFFEEEEELFEGDDREAGLAVDMYQSGNDLIIQTMIAGVTPENLRLTITRDTVTLRGKRVPPRGVPDKDYGIRELYWGEFSREIPLPFEIDTDGAEAVEKYGLLVVRLPKLDTGRVQELKVKSVR